MLSAIEIFQLNSGSYAQPQPALKLLGDGNQLAGMRLVVDMVVVEGGTNNTIVGVGSTEPGVHNTVIDHMVQVGTAHSGKMWTIKNKGTTARNLLNVLAATTARERSHDNAAITTGTSAVGSFIRVYSASVLSFCEQDDILEAVSVNDADAETSSGHAVFHAPRQPSPILAAGAIDISQRMFAPTYVGRRRTTEDGGALQTQSATPEYIDRDGDGSDEQPNLALPMSSEDAVAGEDCALETSGPLST